MQASAAQVDTLTIGRGLMLRLERVGRRALVVMAIGATAAFVLWLFG